MYFSLRIFSGLLWVGSALHISRHEVHCFGKYSEVVRKLVRSLRMKLSQLIGLIAVLWTASHISMQPAFAQSVSAQVRDLSYNEEIQAFFSNATIIHHSAETGTRVAFLAASNTIYFWTPGQESVARGWWRATPVAGDQPMFCAEFARLRCYNLYTFGQNLTERLSGDVFGLRRGRSVPAVIPDRRRYSSRQLRQFAGF